MLQHVDDNALTTRIPKHPTHIIKQLLTLLRLFFCYLLATLADVFGP
jgi:hypothetical protein